jgi:hypothetical protein
VKVLALRCDEIGKLERDRLATECRVNVVYKSICSE